MIVVPWKRGRTVRIESPECNSVDNTPTFSQAMSNLEGSCEELTTSSLVDEATTLLDLPLELILRIASQLEVRDLLALRKVRSKFEKLKSP